MPQSNRKYSSKSSTSSRGSRRSSDSVDSFETYESQSTTPTSYYDYASTEASVREAKQVSSKFQPVQEEDISPSTSSYPRSTVDTFDSSIASEDEDELELQREIDMDSFEEHQEIPPLPVYCRDVVDDVRPSTPQDFAKLFPSMNRLSIRHDEFTPDGNMNLRVDTVAPGRRPFTMQLFHLRMYDLSKRDFSLRRYCRESGREVCNSKRKYVEPATEERPTLQRSLSSAFKTLSTRKPLSRTNSGGSMLKGKEQQRPASSSSSRGGDEDPSAYFQRSASFDTKQKSRPEPTNTMKLEFSNYARVDVSRCGGKNNKRYEFQWWGHKYQWKRVLDKNLGVVSFHLVKDGNTAADAAVAHMVPETRAPNQVYDDESAGGWVPPCHMWISDRSVIEAVTDVADVIVATGLMALVDDCIKDRWQVKKTHRNPLTSKSVSEGPRSLVQHIFQRRTSDHQSSPLRHRPISTY
ncbi:hypothetical protein CGCVW01_v001786 [Colletotrichum viniferum]|nr:hypothetical protein CGCVW01_v001786 [Colletotrichum viniferum]